MDYTADEILNRPKLFQIIAKYGKEILKDAVLTGTPTAPDLIDLSIDDSSEKLATTAYVQKLFSSTPAKDAFKYKGTISKTIPSSTIHQLPGTKNESNEYIQYVILSLKKNIKKETNIDLKISSATYLNYIVGKHELHVVWNGNVVHPSQYKEIGNNDSISHTIQLLFDVNKNDEIYVWKEQINEWELYTTQENIKDKEIVLSQVKYIVGNNQLHISYNGYTLLPNEYEEIGEKTKSSSTIKIKKDIPSGTELYIWTSIVSEIENIVINEDKTEITLQNFTYNPSKNQLHIIYDGKTLIPTEYIEDTSNTETNKISFKFVLEKNKSLYIWRNKKIISNIVYSNFTTFKDITAGSNLNLEINKISYLTYITGNHELHIKHNGNLLTENDYSEIGEIEHSSHEIKLHFDLVKNDELFVWKEQEKNREIYEIVNDIEYGSIITFNSVSYTVGDDKLHLGYNGSLLSNTEYEEIGEKGTTSNQIKILKTLEKTNYLYIFVNEISESTTIKPSDTIFAYTPIELVITNSIYFDYTVNTNELHLLHNGSVVLPSMFEEVGEKYESSHTIKVNFPINTKDELCVWIEREIDREIYTVPTEIIAGTKIFFNTLKYTVGKHQLHISCNGVSLYEDEYEEYGYIGTESNVIIIKKLLEQSDVLYVWTTTISDIIVTSNTEIPSSGWTYKVIENGVYYLEEVTEIGDMLICSIPSQLVTIDKTTYLDKSAVWTTVQNNIDGAVVGPEKVEQDVVIDEETGERITSAGCHLAMFVESNGRSIQDAGFTISKSVPADAIFTDSQVLIEPNSSTAYLLGTNKNESGVVTTAVIDSSIYMTSGVMVVPTVSASVSVSSPLGIFDNISGKLSGIAEIASSSIDSNGKTYNIVDTYQTKSDAEKQHSALDSSIKVYVSSNFLQTTNNISQTVTGIKTFNDPLFISSVDISSTTIQSATVQSADIEYGIISSGEIEKAHRLVTPRNINLISGAIGTGVFDGSCDANIEVVSLDAKRISGVINQENLPDYWVISSASTQEHTFSSSIESNTEISLNDFTYVVGDKELHVAVNGIIVSPSYFMEIGNKGEISSKISLSFNLDENDKLYVWKHPEQQRDVFRLSNKVIRDNIITLPNIKYTVGKNQLQLSYDGIQVNPSEFEEISVLKLPNLKLSFDCNAGSDLYVWKIVKDTPNLFYTHTFDKILPSGDKIKLPFEYIVGNNELVVTYNGAVVDTTKYEEIGNKGDKSNLINVSFYCEKYSDLYVWKIDNSKENSVYNKTFQNKFNSYTNIQLPWKYNVCKNELLVTYNGVVVDSTKYIEIYNKVLAHTYISFSFVCQRSLKLYVLNINSSNQKYVQTFSSIVYSGTKIDLPFNYIVGKKQLVVVYDEHIIDSTKYTELGNPNLESNSISLSFDTSINKELYVIRLDNSYLDYTYTIDKETPYGNSIILPWNYNVGDNSLLVVYNNKILDNTQYDELTISEDDKVSNSILLKFDCHSGDNLYIINTQQFNSFYNYTFPVNVSTWDTTLLPWDSSEVENRTLIVSYNGEMISSSNYTLSYKDASNKQIQSDIIQLSFDCVENSDLSIWKFDTGNINLVYNYSPLNKIKAGTYIPLPFDFIVNNNELMVTYNGIIVDRKKYLALPSKDIPNVSNQIKINFTINETTELYAWKIPESEYYLDYPNIISGPNFDVEDDEQNTYTVDLGDFRYYTGRNELNVSYDGVILDSTFFEEVPEEGSLTSSKIKLKLEFYPTNTLYVWRNKDTNYLTGNISNIVVKGNGKLVTDITTDGKHTIYVYKDEENTGCVNLTTAQTIYGTKTFVNTINGMITNAINDEYGNNINETYVDSCSLEKRLEEIISSCYDSSAVHIEGDETVIGQKTFVQKILGGIEKADTLSLSRTITLESGASGSVSFDGSSDVTLDVTALNASRIQGVISKDNLPLILDTTSNLYYVLNVSSPIYARTPIRLPWSYKVGKNELMVSYNNAIVYPNEYKELGKSYEVDTNEIKVDIEFVKDSELYIHNIKTAHSEHIIHNSLILSLDTVIELPWRYIVGQKSLLIIYNCTLVDSTRYYEIGTTGSESNKIQLTFDCEKDSELCIIKLENSYLDKLYYFDKTFIAGSTLVLPWKYDVDTNPLIISYNGLILDKTKYTEIEGEEYNSILFNINIEKNDEIYIINTQLSNLYHYRKFEEYVHPWTSLLLEWQEEPNNHTLLVCYEGAIAISERYLEFYNTETLSNELLLNFDCNKDDVLYFWLGNQHNINVYGDVHKVKTIGSGNAVTSVMTVDGNIIATKGTKFVPYDVFESHVSSCTDSSSVHKFGDETVDGTKTFLKTINGTVERANGLSKQRTITLFNGATGSTLFDGTEDIYFDVENINALNISGIIPKDNLPLNDISASSINNSSYYNHISTIISSGTEINLGITYTVNKNQLLVTYNGIVVNNKMYSEIGSAGSISNKIKLDFDCEENSDLYVLVYKHAGIYSINDLKLNNLVVSGSGNVITDLNVSSGDLIASKDQMFVTSDYFESRLSSCVISSAVHTYGDQIIDGNKTFLKKIIGTVQQADKFTNPIELSLESGASGSVSFDGSSDITLNVTSINTEYLDGVIKKENLPLILDTTSNLSYTTTFISDISSGTEIELPWSYTVGKNELFISYIGVVVDPKKYTEVGSSGTLSNKITLLFNCESGRDLYVWLGNQHNVNVFGEVKSVSTEGSGNGVTSVITSSGNIVVTKGEQFVTSQYFDITSDYFESRISQCIDSSAVHKTGDEIIDGVKTFVGSVIVPTKQELDSSYNAANTFYVDRAISSLVNGASIPFNTLKGIEDALGNDPVCSSSLDYKISLKANDNEVVHTTGDEVITGVKVFTSPVSGTITQADKFTNPIELSLESGASGSVSFDGSSDVTMAVTSLNASSIDGIIPVSNLPVHTDITSNLIYTTTLLKDIPAKTIIQLPWSYTINKNELLVSYYNVLLDPTQYKEIAESKEVDNNTIKFGFDCIPDNELYIQKLNTTNISYVYTFDSLLPAGEHITLPFDYIIGGKTLLIIYNNSIVDPKKYTEIGIEGQLSVKISLSFDCEIDAELFVIKLDTSYLDYFKRAERTISTGEFINLPWEYNINNNSLIVVYNNTIVNKSKYNEMIPSNPDYNDIRLLFDCEVNSELSVLKINTTNKSYHTIFTSLFHANTDIELPWMYSNENTLIVVYNNSIVNEINYTRSAEESNFISLKFDCVENDELYVIRLDTSCLTYYENVDYTIPANLDIELPWSYNINNNSLIVVYNNAVVNKSKYDELKTDTSDHNDLKLYFDCVENDDLSIIKINTTNKTYNKKFTSVVYANTNIELPWTYTVSNNSLIVIYNNAVVDENNYITGTGTESNVISLKFDCVENDELYIISLDTQCIKYLQKCTVSIPEHTNITLPWSYINNSLIVIYNNAIVDKTKYNEVSSNEISFNFDCAINDELYIINTNLVNNNFYKEFDTDLPLGTHIQLDWEDDINNHTLLISYGGVIVDNQKYKEIYCKQTIANSISLKFDCLPYDELYIINTNLVNQETYNRFITKVDLGTPILLDWGDNNHTVLVSYNGAVVDNQKYKEIYCKQTSTDAISLKFDCVENDELYVINTNLINETYSQTFNSVLPAWEESLLLPWNEESYKHTLLVSFDNAVVDINKYREFYPSQTLSNEIIVLFDMYKDYTFTVRARNQNNVNVFGLVHYATQTGNGNAVTSVVTSSGNIVVTKGENFVTEEQFNITLSSVIGSTCVHKEGNEIINGEKTFTSTIIGNISTADKLFTPHRIKLSSGASGEVFFDGSSDVTLEVTSLDASYISGVISLDNLPQIISEAEQPYFYKDYSSYVSGVEIDISPVVYKVGYNQLHVFFMGLAIEPTNIIEIGQYGEISNTIKINIDTYNERCNIYAWADVHNINTLTTDINTITTIGSGNGVTSITSVDGGLVVNKNATFVTQEDVYQECVITFSEVVSQNMEIDISPVVYTKNKHQLIVCYDGLIISPNHYTEITSSSISLSFDTDSDSELYVWKK